MAASSCLSTMRRISLDMEAPCFNRNATHPPRSHRAKRPTRNSRAAPMASNDPAAVPSAPIVSCASRGPVDRMPVAKKSAKVNPLEDASAATSSWRHPSPRGRCQPAATAARSEEHMSELQSLRHLVCRLLLEKKKQKQ